MPTARKSALQKRRGSKRASCSGRYDLYLTETAEDSSKGGVGREGGRREEGGGGRREEGGGRREEGGGRRQGGGRKVDVELRLKHQSTYTCSSAYTVQLLPILS